MWKIHPYSHMVTYIGSIVWLLLSLIFQVKILYPYQESLHLLPDLSYFICILICIILVHLNVPQSALSFFCQFTCQEGIDTYWKFVRNQESDFCQCSICLNLVPKTVLTDKVSQNQSYVMTDGQPASLSWLQTPIWGPWPDYYYCQTFICEFVDMGHLFWWEDKSVVYIYCWFLPVQSFPGLSPVGLTIIFFYLRFKAGNWSSRSLYLCPPGTEWPNYIPGHRVPFSSPLTTHRSMVEVFKRLHTKYSLIFTFLTD
jgi:hypothetical protein